MRTIKIAKMVASGNDFVVIDTRGHRATEPQSHKVLAKKICDRKFGAGADGLLILEKSKVADVRMRIFNADGSEAEMCGNGARCVALYVAHRRSAVSGKASIETQAGIIEARINADNVRIKLTDPKDIKLDVPIMVNSRKLKVNFADTGVPHAVIFVQGLDEIDVFSLGRNIRYHRKFLPRGTNVNFVEVLTADTIKIRTYERGVEGQTLACGTGAVAAALITAYNLSLDFARDKQLTADKIKVHTAGGETLKVYFNRQGNKFKDVWLEGKAKIVYKGVYYV